MKQKNLEDPKSENPKESVEKVWCQEVRLDYYTGL